MMMIFMFGVTRPLAFVELRPGAPRSPSTPTIIFPATRLTATRCMMQQAICATTKRPATTCVMTPRAG